MDQINKVFDLDSPIAFFPIRHHSPACAYHVQKAIEIYKPEIVLIEGPSDTDPLLPFMADSHPPIAIYNSYQDKEGSHACYYPLQSFSPELVAIKTAAKKNIPIHFIDLPLGSLVSDARTQEKEATTKSWYDDYYLQRSQYIQALCEKENCRSHNELWEKLFEMPALSLSTEQFIKNLLTFCYYSRVGYPAELQREEQNIIREHYMAENILKHQKKYTRILAITGGFHTAALMELTTTAKIQKIKPLEGNAYLIPYSYEECDQLSGYESGMPHPSYYHDLYSRMIAGEEDFFHTTTLTYIAKLAKALRKNKEPISLSEEAAAFSMGLGLASLRDKPQPGVYEYLDGVQSAFVKGELNLATSFIMKEALKLLQGEKIGTVAATAPVPPIVVDFLATAKSFKMNTATTALKTITLDIVSKPRHRRQSIFLHRLAFLDNPYGKKTYGPDYENRTGTKLIREKWEYTYTAHVTSALIEKSHMGGTIEDACTSVLAEQIKNHCHSSEDAADLLLKVGLMALIESVKLIHLVQDNIGQDNSFISLANCFKSLVFLQGIEHILRLNQLASITQAKDEALSRIIPMIPTLTAADEKEDYNLAQQIKTLYQPTNEPFIDALTDFCQKQNIPPTLDGAATGLLYNAAHLSLDDVRHRTNAYLKGSAVVLTGRFLRGIFLTAKDIIFHDKDFLQGLNNTIATIPYEEFLQLLPDLRLAFTFFTPREIDRIGKNILIMLGIKTPPESITSLPQINETDLKTLKSIDEQAANFLKEMGFSL